LFRRWIDKWEKHAECILLEAGCSFFGLGFAVVILCFIPLWHLCPTARWSTGDVQKVLFKYYDHDSFLTLILQVTTYLDICLCNVSRYLFLVSLKAHYYSSCYNLMLYRPLRSLLIIQPDAIKFLWWRGWGKGRTHNGSKQPYLVNFTTWIFYLLAIPMALLQQITLFMRCFKVETTENVVWEI
jgi:hypothetical protein